MTPVSSSSQKGTWWDSLATVTQRPSPAPCRARHLLDDDVVPDAGQATEPGIERGVGADRPPHLVEAYEDASDAGRGDVGQEPSLADGVQAHDEQQGGEQADGSGGERGEQRRVGLGHHPPDHRPDAGPP